MSDRVLIPLPGVGTLALDRETYAAALIAGAELMAASPSPTASAGDEQLLDADGLAAALHVPVTWIEQAARERRIPSLEFGRWRRFKRSEVESSVRNQREGQRA